MRPLDRSFPVLMAILLVSPTPVSPAVIPVDGNCTLPDAITAANADAPAGACPAGSGSDEIRLGVDVVLTSIDNATDGPNGLPSITSPVTIEGNGHDLERRIDAVDHFRLLHVAATGALTLRNTTVSDGGGRGNYGIDGAAIFNRGTARLVDAELRRNGGSFYSYGGAIYNLGDLSLISTTVARSGTPGGLGGAIFNTATLTLTDSIISDAYTDYGGGGLFNEGVATIVGTTFSGNSSSYYGGAIENRGTLNVSNSTISGNSVFYGGGGIANLGTASVVNTTLSGNSGSLGAGLRNLAGVLELVNTLVANSSGDNCLGAITDGGNNLADDATCGSVPDTLAGLDPTLAHNGGATPSHALLAGSNAIDLAGACGLTTDQRGFLRDAACDGGAYEAGAPPPFSGGVVGLDTRSVICQNLTSGDSVRIRHREAEWDCSAAGLATESGDRVSVRVVGARP